MRTPRYRLVMFRRCWLPICLLVVLYGISPQTTAAENPPAAAPDSSKLQFKTGDRVVIIGGAFAERDQAYGYLETAIVARHPDKNLIFRNLGWSGDTVSGDARANFQYRQPNFGFRQLKEMVVANQPNVVLVAYGANEAFAGTAGVEPFAKQYGKLLDMLAATKATVVLLAPLNQEDLGRPLPNPQSYNNQMAEYVQQIKRLGQQRGLSVIDLQAGLDEIRKSAHVTLTDNEVHFREDGYRVVDQFLDEALEGQAADGKIVIDYHKSSSDGSTGLTVADLKIDRAVRFAARSATLGPPALPSSTPPAVMAALAGKLQLHVPQLVVKGLPPGKYTLTIDGQTRGDSTAQQLETGVAIGGFDAPQAEQLRQAIIAKNRLYFYRWRPQNETYLFGFRKEEQGRNAAEVVQFDPLIAEQEAAIAKIRLPVDHHFEIQPIASK